MSETNTPPPADLVVDTPVAAPLHVEPVSPVETAPVEPALELHTDTPTLLEAATKPVEDVTPETASEPEKPVNVKPIDPSVKPIDPDVTKPAEQEVKPEPALEVKYEFKLPEGFTAPKEQIDAYTAVLKETGVTPEVGQRLLDMHLAEQQRQADAAPQQWQAAFKATRDGWVRNTMSDDQLGGSGHQTAMTAAARGRDYLTQGWTPAQKADFEAMLRETGVGDRAAFLRLLYSAARLNDEPAPPSPVQIPPPTNGTRPGAGFKALYDHPGSAARSR